MFLIQKEEDEKIRTIVKHWRENQEQHLCFQSTRTVTELPPRQERNGFFTELGMLIRREAKNVMRDRGTLGVRCGMTTGLTTVLGIVFFRIGSQDADESIFVNRDGYDFQSHTGGITMLGIFGMFLAAEPMLLTFSAERPVFIRERSSDMYGTLPYFLSKTAVEFPIVILQITWAALITYWSIGMQGNFFLLIIALSLVAGTSTSLALLVACMVKDSKQAMECAPALFVPQILFAGFFVKIELIPPAIRWLQYICALKWGMNMVYINEFQDNPFGPQMLAQNNIEKDNLWVNAAILLAMIIVYRSLAVLVLSRKAKAFYN
jgi:ABC-type multidrug transport system permease subunit